VRTVPIVLLLCLACGDDTAPQAQNAPNPPTTPQQTPTELTPPDPSDAIASAMYQRAGEFAADMVPATTLFRGSLTTGQNQDYEAVLQPDRCFKVVGVGAATVTDLDLYLFDPSGAQVQQDTASDAYPVLGLTEPICPEARGNYRVQVRMFGGSGDFGVQVFQTRPD
jgi:hypothetical protein